jgi:hypothetical protein
MGNQESLVNKKLVEVVKNGTRSALLKAAAVCIRTADKLVTRTTALEVGKKGDDHGTGTDSGGQSCRTGTVEL